MAQLKRQVLLERNDSMIDTFSLPNTILILCMWFLGLALFNYVIKAAVRNGVQQANERLLESVSKIEKSVYEIKMEATRKESS